MTLQLAVAASQQANPIPVNGRGKKTKKTGIADVLVRDGLTNGRHSDGRASSGDNGAHGSNGPHGSNGSTNARWQATVAVSKHLGGEHPDQQQVLLIDCTINRLYY